MRRYVDCLRAYTVLLSSLKTHLCIIESLSPDDISDGAILNPFQVELIVGKVSTNNVLKILYKVINMHGEYHYYSEQVKGGENGKLISMVCPVFCSPCRIPDEFHRGHSTIK